MFLDTCSMCKQGSGRFEFSTNPPCLACLRSRRELVTSLNLRQGRGGGHHEQYPPLRDQLHDNVLWLAMCIRKNQMT